MTRFYAAALIGLAFTVSARAQPAAHQATPTAANDRLAQQTRFGSPSSPRRHKSPAIRNLACRTVGRFGARAKPAVPALVEIVKNDRPLRAAAARALGDLGPTAAEAAPVLASLLQERLGPGENRPVIYALGRIRHDPEKTVALLLTRLDSDRDGVIEALGDLAVSSDQVLEVLTKTLRHEYADTRQLAATVLGRLGPGAGKAAPDLKAALRDEDFEVRLAAARSLAQLDALDADGLWAMLDGKWTGMRWLSEQLGTEHRKLFLRSLAGKYDSAMQTLRPRLVVALRDKQRQKREVAAQTLNYVGPLDESAIQALIEALTDDASFVRAYARRALERRIGPHADAMLPRLGKLLEHSQSDTRAQAALVLGSLGPKDQGLAAVRTLIDLLREQRLVEDIQDALVRVASQNAGAAPTLIRALEDKQERVRVAAAEALAAARKESGVDAALTKALGDSSESVQITAAAALVKVGGADKRLLPLLTRGLKVPDGRICRLAAEALPLIAKTISTSRKS